MSTRCQILVVDENNKPLKNFYRHHDSFPENILSMLDKHIDKFLNFDILQTDPYLNDQLKNLTFDQCFDNSIDSGLDIDGYKYLWYGCNNDLQTDLSYVYVIAPNGITVYEHDFETKVIFDQREGQHDMYLCLTFNKIVVLNEIHS